MKFFGWFFGIVLAIVVGYVAFFYLVKEKDVLGHKLANSMSATPIEKNKPTGNPVAMEIPKVPYKQSVANAAQATGVKVIQYSEQGSTVRVKVQWISDNAAQGGDFLDALLNAGVLRDFENKPPVMYRDKQGRAVRTVEYTLFLF